jgi:hypothetical protein
VISEENSLTFKRFNYWGYGLFWNHDPFYDHFAKDECGVEDVLSCYKGILQKEKSNTRWNP